jgi:hypothetical protein
VVVRTRRAAEQLLLRILLKGRDKLGIQGAESVKVLKINQLKKYSSLIIELI